MSWMDLNQVINISVLPRYIVIDIVNLKENGQNWQTEEDENNLGIIANSVESSCHCHIPYSP